MSLSQRFCFVIPSLLLFAFLFSAPALHATDVWDAPAFSADVAALRQAAAAIPAAKDADATIFIREIRVGFDAQGRAVRTTHTIYRIETEEGVEGWAEVRGSWDPWYQAKPELRARVITSDGAVHALDAATLNDVPVHEDSPDLYSDARAYGGPLPAIARGAIVEEEVTTRDSGVFFSGGLVERLTLTEQVPVHRSRVVLTHPESLPFRYVLHLLPEAKVSKTSENGAETITIENGLLPPSTQSLSFAPSDVVLYPEVGFSTGVSWQQVASQYARQVDEKLRLADVQPLIEKLGLKPGSNLDSIRKIVGILHKTVRYTGVEFGESSLVPQFPGETLKRKYGDCKDKATLLIAMLRAAGIPASLALLSAGPGQDINTTLPGMGEFDHAIVYVPATASSPELWIDATAQYTTVGNLPEMDYGRWALIAGEKTTGLTRIPELLAERNRHVEIREINLAEYGPATIVERNEQQGPSEESYREYYTKESKEMREGLEKYFKDTYLSEAAPVLQKGDPADLEKPFVVTLSGKGRRGFTGLNDAVVYLPNGDLFTAFPSYFTTEEKEASESGEDKAAPRTIDWAISPFSVEWRYKITAPLGFKVRALPSDKEEALGAAHFTRKYSSTEGGTAAEVVFHLDSGKSRLTVEEARVTRDAILKAIRGDAIAISFEHAGFALMGEGKTREGLAAYRQLAGQHPKEALHRVQLAQALLKAGLGEKARAVAREATQLDPRSAQAWDSLAWILQHDLIGRRFKSGFDLEDAAAAYRKAKELDPKDKDIRANLAILLEHGPDGVRYTSKARLKDAVDEFQELRKLDEQAGRTYDDNVLYDLWYAGKYKELQDFIAGLASTDLRKSFLLAAVAAVEGPAAAISKSLELTTGSAARAQVLTNAGFLLMRARRYSEASELLTAGSNGQSSESKIAPLLAMLKKARKREDIKSDDSSPSGPVHRLFDLMFSGELNEANGRQLLSKLVPVLPEENFGKKEMQQFLEEMRATAEGASMSLEVLTDIVMSSAEYTPEGDDNLGYKITMVTPGSQGQKFYVVREDRHYKLLELVSPTSGVPQSIGWAALNRLEKNDLEGARKWLDWAREDVHISGGDDPLSGQPFPLLWAKGQKGDETAIRTAALALLPAKELKGAYLASLEQSRDKAVNETQRMQLNLVLARAYSSQERWPELLVAAGELVKAAPDSLVAFQIMTSGLAGMKKFEEWEKLVEARLEKHPGDPDYMRAAARLATERRQFDKARDLLKGLMEKGKATGSDLNLYAWEALFLPGPVAEESVDAAQRANELTKRANFGILHTLGCLYAEQGKTVKAREVLLQAMDAAKLAEPDSPVWFGFGRIAEQLGENDAARIMYARVEKPKTDSTDSTYALARQRLEALNGSQSKSAKSGGE